MKKLLAWLSFWVFYILMAAFTYGYASGIELALQNKAFPDWPMSNRNSAMMMGSLCGVIWPIYWPFHLSRLMWEKK